MIETKFKQSEVGLIPHDWGVVHISDLAQNYTGLTYSPSNTKEYGTLVLRSSNIQKGELCFDDNVYVEMDIPERVIVKPNDILVCVRNGSARLIGKCAMIYETPSPMAFGAFMTILRTNSENNPSFVHYVWQSNPLQKQIKDNLGATINQITNKDIDNFIVAIPTNKIEQEKIANVLSSIDNLISKLDVLIEKKKSIKQGAMQQLLTGKKRLKGFSEPWVINKIGNLCSINGRIGFRGYTKADLVSKGFGAITYSPSDIHDQILDNSNCDYISFQKYEESPEIKVFNGNILFCKTASIGKCAIVENLRELATINPQFVVLKNFKCNNRFLYYSLISKDFQNKILSIIGGSTIPTMSQEKFKDLQLEMPIIEEQTAIANILTKMDEDIASIEQKRAKYIAIKKGMMQQLLTGKIRLI